MELEVYGKAPSFSAHGSYQPSKDAALRPCPFCGGTEVTVENTHTPCYTAECQSCGAQGPPIYYEGRIISRAHAEKAHRETFEQAIIEWNTRHDEA